MTIAACDVADRDALRAVLDDIPPEYPLTSVLHTAAVLDDGVLDAMTPERLATVSAPKAGAAVHLHELTRDLDLREFVLFSSLAGLTGNAGQSGYAAANAFLDALAEYRLASGLPAVSVPWGAWGGDGLAAGLIDQLRGGGVRPMAPELALAALDRTLAGGAAVEAIADIDWSQLVDLSGGSTFLSSLPEVPLAGHRQHRCRRRRVLGRPADRDGPRGTCRHADHPRADPGRQGTQARVAGGPVRAKPVQGPRLRLPDLGRTAQPARCGDRPAPAGRAGLRLPHPGRARRAPAHAAGRRPSGTPRPRRWPGRR